MSSQMQFVHSQELLLKASTVPSCLSFLPHQWPSLVPVPALGQGANPHSVSLSASGWLWVTNEQTNKAEETGRADQIGIEQRCPDRWIKLLVNYKKSPFCFILSQSIAFCSFGNRAGSSTELGSTSCRRLIGKRKKFLSLQLAFHFTALSW